MRISWDGRRNHHVIHRKGSAHGSRAGERRDRAENQESPEPERSHAAGAGGSDGADEGLYFAAGAGAGVAVGGDADGSHRVPRDDAR